MGQLSVECDRGSHRKVDSNPTGQDCMPVILLVFTMENLAGCSPWGLKSWTPLSD